jgi:hypothetical protein
MGSRLVPSIGLKLLPKEYGKTLGGAFIGNKSSQPRCYLPKNNGSSPPRCENYQCWRYFLPPQGKDPVAGKLSMSPPYLYNGG